jgi:hypothetical protein
MLRVKADPNTQTWFEQPHNIRLYRQYSILERTLFCLDRNLEICNKTVPPGEIADFIEKCLIVLGADDKNPDAHMGSSFQDGDYFESIEENTSIDQLRSQWTISVGTHTATFFNERLAPLIALANSFVYCDPYSAKQICSGSFERFLSLVAEANKMLNIRIVTGAPNEPYQDNWELAGQSATRVLANAGFMGSIQLLKRDWDHNRFLRLGFPGGLFLIWEPSFSADRWDSKTFRLDHEVFFSKFSEYDEKKLVNRLLAPRDGLPGMMPFLKEFARD